MSEPVPPGYPPKPGDPPPDPPQPAAKPSQPRGPVKDGKPVKISGKAPRPEPTVEELHDYQRREQGKVTGQK
jgi:hypothetical protein